MRSFIIAGLALSQVAAAALKPVIVADHNFDGVVDPISESDNLSDKCEISRRAAPFLPAITDTDRRCSKKITATTPNGQLDQCHDGTDDTLRHPDRLAPIRTRPIEGAAGGSITASYGKNQDGTLFVDKVRLFKLIDGEWTYHALGSNNTFTSEELAAGLVLGIDGRDVIRPNGWDGRVRLNFKVWEEEPQFAVSDCVQLRVSPILTHHHLQTAQKLFASADVSDYAPIDTFAKDLSKAAAAAGVTEPVELLNTSDVWVQDFFEPGYTSIPGPDGPIGIRIMIRSAQDRSAGRLAFSAIRDANIGAVQDFSGRATAGTLESFGNLETIPPHSSGNKSYPVGRVIQGSWGSDKPHVSDWMTAQGVQDPLILDTSWLYVGHVDEFIQFLPSDNERGWIVVADDPEAGLNLLRHAVASGHGETQALSRPVLSYDPPPIGMPNDTIADVLQFEKFESDNTLAAERIELNLQLIKSEIGLTDADIFRVPALFWSGDWYWNSQEEEETDAVKSFVVNPLKKTLNIIEAAGDDASTLRRRQVAPSQMAAFYPGMVNGVVLPNRQVLAPNPWGPVIDGVDILAAAALEVYSSAGQNLTFMDDYYSHHIYMGEVHCGSNTLREISETWW